jgi:hypothetical protein
MLQISAAAQTMRFSFVYIYKRARRIKIYKSRRAEATANNLFFSRKRHLNIYYVDAAAATARDQDATALLIYGRTHFYIFIYSLSGGQHATQMPLYNKRPRRVI